VHEVHVRGLSINLVSFGQKFYRMTRINRCHSDFIEEANYGCVSYDCLGMSLEMWLIERQSYLPAHWKVSMATTFIIVKKTSYKATEHAVTYLTCTAVHTQKKNKQCANAQTCVYHHTQMQYTIYTGKCIHLYCLLYIHILSTSLNPGPLN